MKLKHAKLHEVVVPTHAGRVNSAAFGEPTWAKVSKIIVVATTDNGITGLGETKRGVSLDAVAAQLRRLAGVDLRTVNLQRPPLADLSNDELWHHEWKRESPRLEEINFNSGNHWAVHSLLMDLLGKAFGVPASVVLGGAYRSSVRVDAWMGRMTPEDSVAVCVRAAEMGYLGIKLKCSLEDGDELVARLVAIREACGVDFKITIDPNERFYRPVESLPLIRRLVEVGNLGCLEDPFPVGRFDWHRELLRSIPELPLALTLHDGPELIEAVSSGACNIANIKGVPMDAKKAGDACWAAGVPCWLGTGVELGVLEAAYVHLAAAIQGVTRPCDLYARLIRCHDLLRKPLEFHGASLRVPTAAGLGVEIDPDALARFGIKTLEVSF